jgi:hypothetical protein
MPMKRLVLLLATLVCLAGGAVGQTGDLGAQIAAADAALGVNPGQITVSASGTISEGKVSLSVGHDLVCGNAVTIFLDAGSYLYQSSQTRIKNCIISSTPTLINGEIQSANTDHVELDDVTFVGGGNLVYWVGVSDFLINDNKVVSITAFDSSSTVTPNGYYLLNCSRGQVNNLTASNFVFPTVPGSIPAVLGLYLSSDVTINNIFIDNVDASYTFGGSGIQLGGSTNITINGGVLTHNAKMDGITSQSYAYTPSSEITIDGVNASYNGGPGGNIGAPLSLGDGIDIINTGHVRIANCKVLGSGYLGNEQPAIWLFLDDDVIVSDSDLSDGSMGGVDIAGSPNVRLINNSINRNQASGTFSEQQGGTATNVGSTVTFADGVSGSFGLPWSAGTPFILDGITYAIASVTDDNHLVLSTVPPDHSSPVNWIVNTTNEEILDGVIDDNGLAGFGGQDQVGINWVDGTTGTISGVTSTNTGIGQQLYGLRLDNTATVLLSGDTFTGNLQGGNGIYGASQYVSQASLLFSGQEVSTTSSAQTVTLAAGAFVIQNLSIGIGGDFSQTNNCGAGLAPFQVCQIQLTFTPTVSGPLSGTLTVIDTDPNSPQTVSLTGTGVVPGLGLSIATGASSSATVTAGMTAKYLLYIGGGGIGGTASLSCTGAPVGATCNVPATQAVSATQGSAFSVSVTTSAAPVAGLRPIYFRTSSWMWGFTVLGWMVLPEGDRLRRRARRCLLCLLLLPLLLLCSCGSSPKIGGANLNSVGTPPGQYALSVTVQLGSTSAQMPLTLVVQ